MFRCEDSVSAVILIAMLETFSLTNLNIVPRMMMQACVDFYLGVLLWLMEICCILFLLATYVLQNVVVIFAHF
jgi:hypothetical protein